MPISRVVLAKEPERFNGTKSDFRSFFFSLKLYFQANPSSFAHRNSKILYTFSCFTGRAAVWSENYTTDHTDAETAEIAFSPWPEFEKELREEFEDTTEKDLAHTRLSACMQGSRSVDEFFDEFEQYARAAGYLQMDPVLIGMPETAVNPSIIVRIYNESNPPTTYKAWKAKAQVFGNLSKKLDIIRVRQQQRVAAATPSASRTPKLSSTYTPASAAPVPVYKDATGVTFGGGGLPMDLDEMRRKGLCFTCKKRGHLARDCPDAPRRKVQVRGMFDSLDDSDKKELRDELLKFLAAEKKDAGFQ